MNTAYLEHSEVPSVASTPLNTKGTFRSSDKTQEKVEVHMLTSTIKDAGEKSDGR